MAEILALGITHYPPLSGPDARMAAILGQMLQNPALPAHLRTPEGWPAPMRAEWGNDQGATAGTGDAGECAIRLNYTGKDVYAVVGGTGTITVTRDGTTTTTAVGGAPTLHQIVADGTAHRDQLDMQVGNGLQVFSFTFG